MKAKNGAQITLPKYVIVLSVAYLFVYYTRIQDNIPGLNAVPWVGAFFLVFTLWGISRLFVENENFFIMPIGLIFCLGVLFAISGIGAISPVSFKMSFKWIFQTFPQCIALVVVFSSFFQLRRLHNLWCLIYFFIALFTLKNAPYGAGDFTRDPNDAALTLSMGIAFLFYSLFQSGLSKTRRFFYYLTLILLFTGIIATSSRGGFLGMVAVILTIWWMSKNRLKIMFLAIVAVTVAGSLLISFIPEKYIDDVQSISDKKDNTRVERLRTWEIGWEMFKANPILGVGAGNFPNTVNLYISKTSWWTGREKNLSGRQTHSLYFDVISELGSIGVLIYGYIMFWLPLKLLKFCKRFDVSNPKQQQIKLFCQALIASMAAYAIAGAFISVAYYPHIPIWLFLYTVVLRVIKDTCGKEFFATGR